MFIGFNDNVKKIFGDTVTAPTIDQCPGLAEGSIYICTTTPSAKILHITQDGTYSWVAITASSGLVVTL